MQLQVVAVVVDSEQARSDVVEVLMQRGEHVPRFRLKGNITPCLIHPRSVVNATGVAFNSTAALMASLIAILDLKGKSLIQRSYRDDVPLSYVERFMPLVLDMEEEDQQVMPCFTSQGINYMHIRHSNLYRE